MGKYIRNFILYGVRRVIRVRGREENPEDLYKVGGVNMNRGRSRGEG